MSIMDVRSYSRLNATPKPNAQDVRLSTTVSDQTILPSDRSGKGIVNIHDFDFAYIAINIKTNDVFHYIG